MLGALLAVAFPVIGMYVKNSTNWFLIAVRCHSSVYRVYKNSNASYCKLLSADRFTGVVERNVLYSSENKKTAGRCCALLLRPRQEFPYGYEE